MANLLAAFVQAAPLYVMFMLVPAFIRLAVERVLLGIDHERVFRYPPVYQPTPLHNVLGRLLPIEIDVSSTITYEQAFAMMVHVALFYPVFEELLFRGLPLLLFGPLGLIVGDVVWVLMHPAWQLQYLAGFPLWKRLAFTLTSAAYFSSAAYFFSYLWLNGYGLVALAYHMLHNAVMTLGEIASNIDIELKWRREKPQFITTEEQEEIPVVFVQRRDSLIRLAESVFNTGMKEFTFVQRREGAEGGESGGSI